MSTPDAFPLVCRLLPPEVEAEWRCGGFDPVLVAVIHKRGRRRRGRMAGESFLLYLCRKPDYTNGSNVAYCQALVQLKPDGWDTVDEAEAKSWGKELGLPFFWSFTAFGRPDPGEEVQVWMPG